jgi:RNA-directed DNA polymerase
VRTAPEELQRLSQELRSERHQRRPARRVWIDKPGKKEKRPLGIPCVRDRVVEGAIRQVLEPIFEHEFAEHSYGFRPEHSAQQAVARVEGLLAAGYVGILDADIQGCSSSSNAKAEPRPKRPWLRCGCG